MKNGCSGNDGLAHRWRWFQGRPGGYECVFCDDVKTFDEDEHAARVGFDEKGDRFLISTVNDDGEETELLENHDDLAVPSVDDNDDYEID